MRKMFVAVALAIFLVAAVSGVSLAQEAEISVDPPLLQAPVPPKGCSPLRAHYSLTVVSKDGRQLFPEHYDAKANRRSGFVGEFINNRLPYTEKQLTEGFTAATWEAWVDIHSGSVPTVYVVTHTFIFSYGERGEGERFTAVMHSNLALSALKMSAKAVGGSPEWVEKEKETRVNIEKKDVEVATFVTEFKNDGEAAADFSDFEPKWGKKPPWKKSPPGVTFDFLNRPKAFPLNKGGKELTTWKFNLKHEELEVGKYPVGFKFKYRTTYDGGKPEPVAVVCDCWVDPLLTIYDPTVLKSELGPNWYTMMAAVAAAGGLGYLIWRRLLKRA